VNDVLALARFSMEVLRIPEVTGVLPQQKKAIKD
jgi:hypothetical protein